MNLLIDTHFVLWFAQGDSRLPNAVRSMIEDPGNNIFASEVSVLEVTIKHGKNPSAMPYSGSDFVNLCKEGGFDLRPLTLEAILAYGSLSFDKVGDLHKDPFDRLLIAQAKTERLTFATRDRLLALYDEPLVSVFA